DDPDRCLHPDLRGDSADERPRVHRSRRLALLLLPGPGGRPLGERVAAERGGPGRWIMTWQRRLAVLLALLAALSVGTHSLAAQVDTQGEERRGGDPLAEIRKSLPADPEAARIALTEALWEAVREVGAAELMLARSLEAGDSIQAEVQR